MRRLPVFFVIDCSESMVGEPIHAVQAGMQQILTTLRQDPYALETVYTSVIAYAGIVRTLVPLTELFAMNFVDLPIGGGTNLGKALQHVMSEIDRNVQLTTTEHKGDWKPIVYLFTDGRPTDDYVAAVEKWNRVYKHKVSLVAVGLGAAADFNVLQQFADHCISIEEVNQDYIKGLCKWISASVVSQSVSIGMGRSQDQQLLNFDQRYMNLVKEPVAKKQIDDHSVTMVGRCQKTNQPYIMKYVKALQYQAPADLNINIYHYRLEVCSGIDEDYFSWSDKNFEQTQINTAQLDGTPQCPHCYAETAFAMCGCGNLLCYDGYSSPVVCPWCHRQIRFSEGGSDDFSINRGQG
ncbi:uncharacterized protein YegL [Acinetobacter calcoaceticus]|uniref:Uncharacterized protein YegL n=1 Tax=Acinetobacter calcoaceticus TaxID=471 RepID=A0A4R1XVD9_ACICA|nr:uncharacterized protein YegL [Acinetobacter calcoaceticus]